ncbi:hypothetical protein T07_13440 [Trichinella nelsoni]|uniref:Uncharacterized protein n=5 Tax=Trichinella TaxID=6333 RepID=A0A0V0S6G4_9BILA|nr:hypothetical protein T07_13440 [Trichinella nelsoni]
MKLVPFATGVRMHVKAFPSRPSVPLLITNSIFDYCSVHVSTVISHVSQQFRFLVFFIVTQWVVSVQWNYFYKLEYLSLMVVQVSLNGLKRCTKICKNGLHHQHRARSYSCVSLGWLNDSTCAGFRIHRTSLVVRVAINAFGEYFGRVISGFRESFKGNMAKKIAHMQIFICPQATPRAMPQAIFRKFRNFLKFSPRRRLRLCPRANKNLHMPLGYPPGNL